MSDYSISYPVHPSPTWNDASWLDGGNRQPTEDEIDAREREGWTRLSEDAFRKWNEEEGPY